MFEDGIIFFINVIMFDEMEIFKLFVRVSSIQLNFGEKVNVFILFVDCV